ncbi:MAG TPA: septal ring lytic transglycosylase RlpA family protein [Allosphingosinicella sp.]
MHLFAAFAFAGLSTSAPAQEIHAAGNIADLARTVSTLAEAAPVEAAPTEVAPVETPDAFSYEAAGQGEASYYGAELAGNRTASGERFNPQALTAAHRSLPLGTKLRVTNLSNGKSVIVRINDRGPFARSRLIDVSLGAARTIGMIRSGKAQVKLEIVRSTV